MDFSTESSKMGHILSGSTNQRAIWPVNGSLMTTVEELWVSSTILMQLKNLRANNSSKTSKRKKTEIRSPFTLLNFSRMEWYQYDIQRSLSH